MSIKPILTILLAGATLGTAQDQARRAGVNVNPCPFGVISIGEVDVVVVPGLEELLRMSDLVVVGTVVSTTDFALLFGSETYPFSCSRVKGHPGGAISTHAPRTHHSRASSP